MHAWIFKSNDTCACAANLNRNCPHTYIYGKLGTLAKYQCWNKTDKTGISTGQSVSVKGFQVSLWEVTECVKPSSIDNNIGIASFCLIISLVCKMVSFF